MTRYFRLWLHFFKNNLVREMEFRGHFLLNILVEVFWSATGIVALELIFIQTNSIVGWSKGEIFMIYAFWRLVSGFNSFFFVKNIDNFSNLVNTGEFDFVLTKPVNTLFLTTTRLVNLSGLSQTVLGFIFLTYGSILTKFDWTPSRILLATIMILAGTLVKHSIYLITITPLIWLQKIQNIGELHISLFAPARFPAETYPKFLRYILIFIIPVLLTAAIPTAVVIGKLSQFVAILVVVASITFYFVAYKFFYFALRHYSSASS